MSIKYYEALQIICSDHYYTAKILCDFVLRFPKLLKISDSDIKNSKIFF